MRAKPLPEADYLRRSFAYEPETGLLRWRCGQFAGKVAGCPAEKVGVLVRLDRVLYKASRIIWKIATGRDPTGLIDHHDGDHFNNRWTNLREATKAQNSQNSRRRRNHDLPKGVQRCRDKFQTAIYLNRKRKFIGVFDTVAEARAAYIQAAQRHFGEFFRAG
jgi:hypothetical protein